MNVIKRQGEEQRKRSMDEMISYFNQRVSEMIISIEDKMTILGMITAIGLKYEEDTKAVQPDNQVHLCDSCSYTYPECPSVYADVIFGNGIGNDNICACSKYLPSAQPERAKGHWIPVDSYSAFGGDETTWMAHGNPIAYYYCSNCKEQARADEEGNDILSNFCPECGADMRGET